MHFTHIPLPREVPALKQINENGTRFYTTPAGNKYPSITTVLSEYNKEAIYKWRQRVGNEEANKISQTASTRGTRIHKLCEDFLNNKDITFKTPLDAELFNSLKPELYKIDNIHSQELRMYSDHLRVAGTVDCIGDYNNRRSVIDFKTSSKQKDKCLIENYFMQAAAYAIMFEELYSIPVAQIVIMIAVQDNEPQVFVEKRDNYVKQLLYFRNLFEGKYGIIT